MRQLFGAVLLGLGLVLVLGGNASVADIDMAAALPAEADTPAETEAPDVTEPAADTPAADDGTTTVLDGEGVADEDADGSMSPFLIALVLALLAGIAYLIFRPRRSAPDTGARPTAERLRAADSSLLPLDERVLGDVSWLNDQLSLELLSSPADQARQRWQSERSRIDALARDCQRLEESRADPIWGALAGEVASLAKSLDTATSARAAIDVDPSVIQQAVDLVNRGRAQLSGLATQVRQR